MKPEVSIIIAYYNDVDTLIGTIDSLYETIDVDNFELIVVNDGSQEKLPSSAIREKMQYVSHFVNTGVGTAFDTGVRIAKSDNIILMGADIRFFKNKWATKMLGVIDKHEKAIVCTTCKSFTSDRTEYGADIIFTMENENIGKQHWGYFDETFKGILQGRWRRKTGDGVYQIPCLMGAFYGVKREWYQHIKGFVLHYRWGSLEPYISLKSWALGGEVLVDTDNETMHIWRTPQRKSDFAAVYYNQLLVAGTVFGKFGKKYANHLLGSSSRHCQSGADIYQDKYTEINTVAQYINENKVMEYEELERKMVELSYEYNEHDRFKNPVS